MTSEFQSLWMYYSFTHKYPHQWFSTKVILVFPKRHFWLSQVRAWVRLTAIYYIKAREVETSYSTYDSPTTSNSKYE